MEKTKKVQWVLRIAVAGEFIGHGTLALQGNQQWVGWIDQLLKIGVGPATQLLFLIGLSDLVVALIVLVKPIRAVLLWAAIWGFWTAILRPIVGQSIWDCIERSANWGAPLALLLLYGWPKNFRDWFKM